MLALTSQESNIAVALSADSASASHADDNDDLAPDQGQEPAASTVPQAGLLADFAELVCSGMVAAGEGGGGVEAASASAVGRVQLQVAARRRELALTLGEAAMYDACAVIAMFNGINKVADACGVHLDELQVSMADAVLEQLKMKPADNWDMKRGDGDAVAVAAKQAYGVGVSAVSKL